jgi:hypothetical protein
MSWDNIFKNIDSFLHAKSIKHHEEMDFIRGIKGSIFAKMIHSDGTMEDRPWPNIVLERASILIARILIGESLQPGAVYQDIYGNNTAEKIRGITHLALGIGKPFETYNESTGTYIAISGDDISNVLNVQGLPQEWDKQSPPNSTVLGGRTLVSGNALFNNSQVEKPILVNEIGRKKFQRVQYLNDDFTVSALPTNIIELECEFGETEAVGTLMEMGLFGGNVEPFDRDYIAMNHLEEYGDMVNYRTFKVWNKSDTDRLQIRWRITIPKNDAIPESAD